MEVRCCCDPEKLLGWLDAPARMGAVVFSLRLRPGGDPAQRFECVTLEVAPFHNGGTGGEYLAVKGHDVTQLRRIPSFREAT